MRPIFHLLKGCPPKYMKSNRIKYIWLISYPGHPSVTKNRGPDTEIIFISLMFCYMLSTIYKNVTNYNTYKLLYTTTETMPQGAKYNVYPVAFLKIINKLHKTTRNCYYK